MRRGLRVCRCMSVGRVVAAAHMAATEADPQVEPLAAGSKAILAAVDGGGQLEDRDLIQMAAADAAHGAP